MATSFIEPGIFNNPRPKKSVLPPPNKRRRIDHKVEEISFDDSKREDYLTGFHKRKLQRIKRAQEENEKKAKEERRQMRKQVNILITILSGNSDYCTSHSYEKRGKRN